MDLCAQRQQCNICKILIYLLLFAIQLHSRPQQLMRRRRRTFLGQLRLSTGLVLIIDCLFCLCLTIRSEPRALNYTLSPVVAASCRRQIRNRLMGYGFVDELSWSEQSSLQGQPLDDEVSPKIDFANHTLISNTHFIYPIDRLRLSEARQQGSCEEQCRSTS